MSKLLNFEQLWELANSAAKACNGINYHPCCDVWTTKASKLKRSSHIRSIQWRRIIQSLKKPLDDKKLALQEKMAGEGWRLPALLNQPCKYQLPQTAGPQLPFRPHHPENPPRDLRASLVPQDFSRQDEEYSLLNASGTVYSYKPFSIVQTILSKSNLSPISFCCPQATSPEQPLYRPLTLRRR